GPASGFRQGTSPGATVRRPAEAAGTAAHFVTGRYSTPNCWNRNAYTSACWAKAVLRDVPAPWPVPKSISNSTGRFDDVAACSRAANLRELAGSTRPSLAPVRISTAGYAVPSFTCWYGE